jgi:hypothetical protein
MTVRYRGTREGAGNHHAYLGRTSNFTAERFLKVRAKRIASYFGLLAQLSRPD